MRTICFYNHKGGVGKTTMCSAIAGELINQGKKVLLIDCDSQANLSSTFCPKVNLELADYFFNNNDVEVLKKVIHQTNYENLFIIPSKKLSVGGRIDEWKDTQVIRTENRNVIENFIKTLSVSKLFDFILIDMPPSYSELDKKILLVSDEVIPVLKIDVYSMEGYVDFYKLLTTLKAGDEKPEFKKIIFNGKDGRSSMQKQILPNIDNLKQEVYVIPNDSIFEKSKASKQTVQSFGGLKKETNLVLAQIANDIIKE